MVKLGNDMIHIYVAMICIMYMEHFIVYNTYVDLHF